VRQGYQNARILQTVLTQKKETLPDIRCGHCQRKLGEGHYSQLAIKCPRCGTLNL